MDMDESTTDLGHASIDNEVRSIDEAALIARKEEHGLSLFNGFAKASSREMDLTAVAFGCVVAEPVLEEWCTSHEYTLLVSSRSSPSNQSQEE